MLGSKHYTFIRAPLKTALKRENEIIVPRARRGSESVLAHGEEA